MSFTNAPVTRALVLGLVASSIAISLFDVKHYFYIFIDTHIFRYRQTWRALAYQLCYTNSSEVLVAAITLYNMRVVERIWGSRKYATFILTTGVLTAFIVPVLMVMLRPLTFGVLNYLPAGPTPVILAILVQYHSIIPHIYKYRLALSTSAPANEDFIGLTFSDKSYRYLFAVQLALSQWPGSLLGASVGWLLGYAWRNELLPGFLTHWRVPGWVVGIHVQKRSAEFEGLRRRLEGETSIGSTSGVQHPTENDASRRRTIGQQLMDQVRGAF